MFQAPPPPDTAIVIAGNVATISNLGAADPVLVRVPIAPACWANCDGSTQSPILNNADFTCFLQRFASGDPYANCDGSTTPPTLNVLDFTCYTREFAKGCQDTETFLSGQFVAPIFVPVTAMIGDARFGSWLGDGTAPRTYQTEVWPVNGVVKVGFVTPVQLVYNQSVQPGPIGRPGPYMREVNTAPAGHWPQMTPRGFTSSGSMADEPPAPPQMLRAPVPAVPAVPALGRPGTKVQAPISQTTKIVGGGAVGLGAIAAAVALFKRKTR